MQEEGIKKVKDERKKEYKKERRMERKKEFRVKGGKKKKSSAGFKPVRLVLLVFVSVEQQGVVGRIGFTFLPS